MYKTHQFRVVDVVSDPATNKSTIAPYSASPAKETR